MAIATSHSGPHRLVVMKAPWPVTSGPRGGFQAPTNKLGRLAERVVSYQPTTRPTRPSPGPSSLRPTATTLGEAPHSSEHFRGLLCLGRFYLMRLSRPVKHESDWRDKNNR